MGDTGVMNCYEVLGLMRGASVEDIKAAFRLRSHMFHPDKYENYAEPLRTQLMAEAGKEFKKLTAAYEILRDPARRTAHDRELSARDRQAGVASVRAAPARASTRRAVSPATTADGEEAPAVPGVPRHPSHLRHHPNATRRSLCVPTASISAS